MSSLTSTPIKNDGTKVKPILKKPKATFGPIALCARSEDSPNKHPSKRGRPNLKLVSKEDSKAAMAMNIAATWDFTRLDSMKPP